MKEIIIGMWLGILGYLDFKYREIPQWLIVLGGILGILFCLGEQRALLSVLCSCLPGVAALLFSRITKEVMGYGDGMVLLVLGLFFSISRVLSIGMAAFALAGLMALALLVIFRKRGNYRIPFLPFLTVAYGLECWIQAGERMV